MTWDKDLPSGGQKFNVGDDAVRANNAALETAIGNEHDFSTGSTQTWRFSRGKRDRCRRKRTSARSRQVM